MADKNAAPIYDRLDYSIITILNRNARLPATEIAEITGADVRTVRNRINRLIDSGAIRLAAIVDPVRFGYHTHADVFLEVEPAREPELVEYFIHKGYVSYAAYGTGSGEVSLEVRFKSQADLREFVTRDAPAMPGVIRVSYALVPLILKNIDQWLPGEDDFEGWKPEPD